MSGSCFWREGKKAKRGEKTERKEKKKSKKGKSKSKKVKKAKKETDKEKERREKKEKEQALKKEQKEKERESKRKEREDEKEKLREPKKATLTKLYPHNSKYPRKVLLSAAAFFWNPLPQFAARSQRSWLPRSAKSDPGFRRRSWCSILRCGTAAGSQVKKVFPPTGVNLYCNYIIFEEAWGIVDIICLVLEA